MERVHAGQIAELLNARNRLVVRYDADRILAASDNYLYLLSAVNEVVACAELKRVQWYQCELSHLTVANQREGKGDAWKLLQNAEARTQAHSACILQCTIREGNSRSQRLFERNGFLLTATFYYPISGNNVGVWQKAVSPAKMDEVKPAAI